jgi:hypothetical protein
MNSPKRQLIENKLLKLVNSASDSKEALFTSRQETKN